MLTPWSPYVRTELIKFFKFNTKMVSLKLMQIAIAEMLLPLTLKEQ